MPKAEFYENAWGLPYSDNANALFTAVSRLNKKLDDNKADVTITYERGKGYALESITDSSTVPKAELYENVWGLPYSDNANALFTAVSRLNKKLDDNKADVTITYE